MPHLDHILDRVSDFFEKKDKKHGSPGGDSKKHSKVMPPPVPGEDELVNKFENLSLDGKTGKHPKAEFVGGFKHGPAKPDSGRTPSSTPPTFPASVNQACMPPSPSPPGPLPRPPRVLFPTPVHYRPSRMMQFALSEDSLDPAWLELEPTAPESSKPPKPPKLPSRPHSDEPPRKNNLNASPARLRVPRPVSSPPMTPNISKASSSGETTPDRRASGDERTQCSGITKKGERCTRQIKANPPLNIVDPEVSLEVFCHQHRKEFLTKQSGFISRKTNEWVEFSKYIPGYLHPDTQAALRIEMEKPPSQSDEPGFIYAFEIRDPDTPFLVKLKVGRTVILEGRLNNWQKQCGSKEQVLRGWWPGNIADGDLETSLLKGRIQSGEKGAYCHKLERLVHLELADLVVHAPYLHKGFPNMPSTEEGATDIPNAKKTRSNPGTPTRNGKRSCGSSSTALNSLQKGNEPCPDCGSMHKEIFPFTRPEDGPYKGQEWDKLAKPVIEKWGWFIETLA